MPMENVTAVSGPPPGGPLRPKYQAWRQKRKERLATPPPNAGLRRPPRGQRKPGLGTSGGATTGQADVRPDGGPTVNPRQPTGQTEILTPAPQVDAQQPQGAASLAALYGGGTNPMGSPMQAQERMAAMSRFDDPNVQSSLWMNPEKLGETSGFQDEALAMLPPRLQAMIKGGKMTLGGGMNRFRQRLLGQLPGQQPGGAGPQVSGG